MATLVRSGGGNEMGADTGPCMGAGRTAAAGSRRRRGRFCVVLSVLVIVQVGGGCDWLNWASDSVVADAEQPADFSRTMAASADVIPSSAAPTTVPPTTVPPTTVPPTTVPPTTVPPEAAPLGSGPGATSPPPQEPEPMAVLIEPAPPIWSAGSAQARALEHLGDSNAREVASHALTLIRYDWPNGLPGWQIRFLPGRTGYRGLTYSEQRVIEVFIRPSDSAEAIAHVTAHELAHAIDVDRFGPAERSMWSAARGHRPGTPWFVHSGLPDFASGAGDFAESFAWWQTTGSHWSGQLGPPPSPTQVGLLAMLTGGW